MANTQATNEQGSGIWARFTADMASYVNPSLKPWRMPFLRQLAREFFNHPGLLAVVVYRYGQWVDQRCRMPLARPLFKAHYRWLYLWVRMHLQIEIPAGADIDGGLHIYHFGSIIVNGRVVAGKNLKLSQGVLIGQTDPNSIPRLGDNVVLNNGAKVIGGVILGSNVEVGAGAVVTKSFPDNAIIAGVPAKLLRVKSEHLTEHL